MKTQRVFLDFYRCVHERQRRNQWMWKGRTTCLHKHTYALYSYWPSFEWFRAVASISLLIALQTVINESFDSKCTSSAIFNCLNESSSCFSYRFFAGNSAIPEHEIQWAVGIFGRTRDEPLERKTKCKMLAAHRLDLGQTNKLTNGWSFLHALRSSLRRVIAIPDMLNVSICIFFAASLMSNDRLLFRWMDRMAFRDSCYIVEWKSVLFHDENRWFFCTVQTVNQFWQRLLQKWRRARYNWC